VGTGHTDRAIGSDELLRGRGGRPDLADLALQQAIVAQHIQLSDEAEAEGKITLGGEFAAAKPPAAGASATRMRER